MTIGNLYTDAAALAAGAAAVLGWRKFKPEAELVSVQGKAIAVDTLRDVILELRTELDRVRGQLGRAETLIESLLGERLPATPKKPA